MTINQVYPRDWELTRAGDKAARSVPNAKRAIHEFCQEYEMDWLELQEWPMLALQLVFDSMYDFVPMPHCIDKAFRELNKECRESP